MFSVRQIVAFVVAVVIAVIGLPMTSQATPIEARADMMSTSVNPASSAVSSLALIAASTTTRSCSTGGYWYETDTVFVTKSRVNNQFKYVVSWGGNRDVYIGHPKYDTWKHRAYKLSVRSGGSLKNYYYPGKTTTLYSKLGTDDFTMQIDTYLNGRFMKSRFCTVGF